MTEAEWLVSDDPQAMLRLLTEQIPFGAENRYPVSDHKMCSWIYACREMAGIKYIVFDISHPDGLRDAINAYSHDRIDALPLPVRANLLRDIIGNPFQPVAPLQLEDNTWAWAALGLANAIYKDRTFNSIDMPILADMLIDAGCDAKCWACDGVPKQGRRVGKFKGRAKLIDDICEQCLECDGTGRTPHPILAHLRSSGPHVRGCWAIDLLLGKE